MPEGTAFDKALELAQRVGENAPLTNYALMHALPRIAEQPADHGFFTEALMAGIAQSAPEAKERVRDFLEGRAAKVRRTERRRAAPKATRTAARCAGPTEHRPLPPARLRRDAARVLREGAPGVRYLQAEMPLAALRATA